MQTETHQIAFGDDTLHAIQNDQGEVFVAVKPIIEGLGLDWSSMLRKLRKDEDLGMGEITIPTIGGSQSAVCLPLERVPALLTQIRPSAKMTAATREKLSLYRREAFAVLWKHFQERYGVPRSSGLESASLLIEELRRQLLAEVAGLVTAELQVQRAALPAPAPRTLTPQQQREVQQGVRDIARAWCSRGELDYRTAIARTWNALKEHFGVVKYDQIRADQWNAVESWLRSREVNRD